ncbi:MAG: hypothetical protein U0441_19255 [Polyangiaceae bacterium]
MRSGQPVLHVNTAFGLAMAVALATGCAPDSQDAPERAGQAHQAVFANGGFETGVNGAVPPSWTVGTFLNPGVTISTPQTEAGLNLSSGGVALTTIKTATTPESKTDPDLGSSATLRYPKFGKACVVVNNTTSGKNKNVNVLSQTMTVGAGDIDPADGKIHIRFVVAPVLENPNHNLNEQPYFFFHVANVTKGTTLYEDFNFSAQAGVPWKSSNSIYYTDWQLVDIAPDGAALEQGDQVELEIYAAGCSLGGHWGRLYVDGIGSVVPGLFVSATGPAAASAGSDITYTFTYKNGSASGASSVVVEFNTPPNTTYSSLSAPGLTCTKPAAGSAGKVSCAVGALAAAAFGSFEVTVHIDAAATGSIVNGNYDIYATSVSPLLGAKVTTLLGCSADADCGAGQWCKLAAPSACTPTLANGSHVPTDAPHTSPVLNGTCTAGAASLTCASGVCEPADDLCGYSNGVGPCDADGIQCRSGVCDLGDSKCGYQNDTGPCTVANGPTICRAMVCDPDDLKCGLANDNGPCTAANAAVVCRSGVCGPDGRCGYGDNIGPCTGEDGATVCRSGVCGEGICAPDLGCQSDAECSGGKWCNLTIPDCEPPAPNGSPLPGDALHEVPVLDGACTAEAGALVCASGVCDAFDDLCGYRNDSGPCTIANEGSVCRSGVCDLFDSRCGYQNGAGQCSPANAALVCRSSVCDPDGQCGYANDSGPCTAATALAVCRSGVCDGSDNLCGFADGDGPCTSETANLECRSGACSAAGVCMPPGACYADADCQSSEWCSLTLHACLPDRANGVPMPTDPPHVDPILNAECTAGASALVCVSAVCDAGDNKCGYANSSGPCTAANAEIVCRSGACDPDHACGYANEHGPCTAANAAVVCRSGVCSANGTCMAAGGCNADADCPASKWCHIAVHQCTARIPNGGAVATDPPHESPALTGDCTAAAGALVCESAACDPADDKCGLLNGTAGCDPENADIVCRSSTCDLSDGKCGLLNGHGSCTAGNAEVVCRSGACSPNGSVCIPAGGCAVDADCGPAEWCHTATFACKPKLANGAAMPTVAGHAPALAGKCTALAASAVCASGVCDAADDKCGYANDHGPCSAADQSVVCRSGRCDSSSVCAPPGACKVDLDCDVDTEFCDTAGHTCAVKLPNGAPLLVVGAHAPPLDGKCDALESKVVCASAVCDADNLCGYASGTGPCTAEDAGVVCRSGTCSPNGSICIPSGGCGVDADCGAEQWCNTELLACVPKLLNGASIPTVAAHAPELAGKCTVENAKSVCDTGVCDKADDKCGYAAGDGPCDAETGALVCRTGACSVVGLCVQPSACFVDADCDEKVAYCDTAAHLCAAKLANGAAMPSVTGHSPVLDGSCNKYSAPIVCQSGVCDPADDKCGHANGQGPCDAASAEVVCRSGLCALAGPNEGLCVECAADDACEGAEAVCDLAKNECVQCTKDASAACEGATPICAVSSDKCAPCDGDLGAGTELSCPDAASPLCFLAGPMAGECGKCMTNADCAGHASGPFCDTEKGTCGDACHVDADCPEGQLCDAGVCADEPKDPVLVHIALCKSDAECPSSRYCAADGECVSKLSDGETCASANQCQSSLCESGECLSPDHTIPVGNGLFCATRPGSDSQNSTLVMLGFLAAITGLAARRRR